MARSEEIGSAVMLEAEALNSRGDFRATVLLLEPLLANNAAGLSPGEMGDGWVLLGTANQFLGEYEKARRNFEAAIRVLKDDPKEARAGRGGTRQFRVARDGGRPNCSV